MNQVILQFPSDPETKNKEAQSASVCQFQDRETARAREIRTQSSIRSVDWMMKTQRGKNLSDLFGTLFWWRTPSGEIDFDRKKTVKSRTEKRAAASSARKIWGRFYHFVLLITSDIVWYKVARPVKLNRMRLTKDTCNHSQRYHVYHYMSLSSLLITAVTYVTIPLSMMITMMMVSPLMSRWEISS